MLPILKNKPAMIWTAVISIALIVFLYFYFTGSSENNAPDEYYNPSTIVGLISPFKNKEEETAYQKWYIQQHSAGMPDSTLQRKQFDHFYTK